ncbi:SAM dependent carboxyl methyltransferase [Labrenzia sp. THAF82]|uniref:hypothetical protein n=1 Tax=Labrenzia sp. THAF82 TaxID=2587861 RepID=UPI0012A9FD18|nr:hypothetical protein [Labrenzia sp. THAF82]QFT32948.1 SAM dependent carboxyl methyltransferase [Labrenzia sp. THAF82]
MAEPARATHGMIDYDLNSVDQIKNIEEHETLLREYAGKTQSLNEVPAIADFGCGPGLGSLRTVRPVLDVWRKAPPAQRVSACFVDLPGNDWSALRSRLFGQDGIVSKPNPPQIQLVARDFYKEIFPKNALSLSTAFYATHWLSRPQTTFSPGTLWFHELPALAYADLRQKALNDFAHFVKNRMHELATGGRLIVSTMGSVADRNTRNGVAPSRSILMPFATETAYAMVKDGLLEQSLVDNFVVAVWFLTADDARSAIHQAMSQGTACDIEHLDIKFSDGQDADPLGGLLMTPHLYARKKTKAARAVLHSTLKAHLFTPSSDTPLEAAQLAEIFYERMERAIWADACRGPNRRHLEKKTILTVVLKKTEHS